MIFPPASSLCGREFIHQHPKPQRHVMHVQGGVASGQNPKNKHLDICFPSAEVCSWRQDARGAVELGDIAQWPQRSIFPLVMQRGCTTCCCRQVSFFASHRCKSPRGLVGFDRDSGDDFGGNAKGQGMKTAEPLVRYAGVRPRRLARRDG